jgi:hypothetical protein
VGILAASVAEARDAIRRGFRAIAYGLDAWVYEDALRTGIDAVRGLAKAAGGA